MVASMSPSASAAAFACATATIASRSDPGMGSAHAGTRRDELADDHVLLEAVEAVAAAFDGRLGEHASGLLERRRREPRVGGERRLGDAHELGAPFGRLVARLDETAVGVGED